jgi:hypothetical protein
MHNRAMKALALVACAIGGSAWADAPKVMDERGAINALIPGMAEADARALAEKLGCSTIDAHATVS